MCTESHSAPSASTFSLLGNEWKSHTSTEGFPLNFSRISPPKSRVTTTFDFCLHRTYSIQQWVHRLSIHFRRRPTERTSDLRSHLVRDHARGGENQDDADSSQTRIDLNSSTQDTNKCQKKD